MQKIRTVMIEELKAAIRYCLTQITDSSVIVYPLYSS